MKKNILYFILGLALFSVLAGCASTQDSRRVVQSEVRDYRYGGVPGSSPVVVESNTPAITAPKMTQTTPDSLQTTITTTKNWPRVSRLDPTDANRNLIISELGPGANKTDTPNNTQTTSVTPTPDSPATPEIAPNGAQISTGDVQFVWPANGKVLRPFDNDKLKGIEIDGKVGESVLASADGQVIYTGSGLRGYGKLIVIKHNNNYLSVYGHNSKILVKENSNVKQGSKIAEIGDTDSDRPKLFFQIRRDKNSLDPLRILPRR